MEGCRHRKGSIKNKKKGEWAWDITFATNNNKEINLLNYVVQITHVFIILSASLPHPPTVTILLSIFYHFDASCFWNLMILLKKIWGKFRIYPLRIGLSKWYIYSNIFDFLIGMIVGSLRGQVVQSPPPIFKSGTAPWIRSDLRMWIFSSMILVSNGEWGSPRIFGDFFLF